MINKLIEIRSNLIRLRKEYEDAVEAGVPITTGMYRCEENIVILNSWIKNIDDYIYEQQITQKDQDASF